MSEEYQRPKRKNIYVSLDTDDHIQMIADKYGLTKIDVASKLILGVFVMGSANISDILKLGTTYSAIIETGFSLPFTKEPAMVITTKGHVESVYDKDLLASTSIPIFKRFPNLYKE